ncbi:MAG: sigma-70 family RNA polymerase sigma factor [bacterium]|nr:sigma-70 family RNA polymerase sigma factor [bacterium]
MYTQSSIRHSRDLTPEHYEWAHLGLQARKFPGEFTLRASQDGLRNPEEFTIEVGQIGNAASWEIVAAFSGLTKTIAKRYSRNDGHPTLNFEDISAVGNLGVYERSGLYFPKLDTVRATTYFVNSARSGIIKYMNENSSTVRVPGDRRSTIRDLDRLRHHRNPVTGRGISRKSAFDILGITDEKTRSIIERARLVSYEMGSIDNGFSPQVDDPSDSDYSPAMTSVFDVGDPNPFDIAEKRVRAEEINRALETSGLSERDIRILRDRFGIGDELSEPKTLERVGKACGISGGRAREIELKALSKLRHARQDNILCPTEVITYTAYYDQTDENGNNVLRSYERQTKSRIVE